MELGDEGGSILAEARRVLLERAAEYDDRSRGGSDGAFGGWRAGIVAEASRTAEQAVFHALTVMAAHGDDVWAQHWMHRVGKADPRDAARAD